MADENPSKPDHPRGTVQSPLDAPVHDRHSFERTTLSEKTPPEDEQVYPKDVSFEKGTITDPGQNGKDLEDGGSSPPAEAWYRRDPYWRYLRHWKRGLFIVIWLLFTG